ncbi:Obtusifoliol 14-alpha demethylase [Cytospora mali]|uniref:Obtusifoliol 14-alpha demethylase n=1 Tax=Cytospora mali TaxID=578113 RepID=A0A194W1L0_CYTMA|nr:Obtusifoliol 14-alpha demethylase [Valsa mali]
MLALEHPPLPANAPALWKADDWPVIGALRFYTQRADMVLEATDFFSHSGSNTAELLTGLPLTKGDVERFGGFFIKSMTALLRHDNFVRNLHLLTRDARVMCEELLVADVVPGNPEWRVMNPFNVLYRLVYQMTMRTVGAEEVADNRALGDYTLAVFQDLEKRNSTAKVYLPWLPSPAHYLRMWDGFRLYRVFSRIIKERQSKGTAYHDSFQYLIDSGASVKDITGFEINSLFGGQINTGINAAWLPIFLSVTPQWKARVVAEVDGVISRHRTSPDQKVADVLEALSLDIWQTEFPLLVDMCLRESIRLTIRGSPMRKNVTDADVALDSHSEAAEVIPVGAYATYLLDLVHFNSDIYSDPLRFDPGRYEPDRAEDKKVPHAFLGWGSGRHPCLGTRFAKLEITLIMAHFFAFFEFELAADANATPTAKAPPLPNRNLHAVSRPEQPVYMRYKPRPGAF